MSLGSWATARATSEQGFQRAFQLDLIDVTDSGVTVAAARHHRIVDGVTICAAEASAATDYTRKVLSELDRTESLYAIDGDLCTTAERPAIIRCETDGRCAVSAR